MLRSFLILHFIIQLFHIQLDHIKGRSSALFIAFGGTVVTSKHKHIIIIIIIAILLLFILCNLLSLVSTIIVFFITLTSLAVLISSICHVVTVVVALFLITAVLLSCSTLVLLLAAPCKVANDTEASQGNAEHNDCRTNQKVARTAVGQAATTGWRAMFVELGCNTTGTEAARPRR
eukprot:PLAT3511.1.p1 GENE.PLAT3511.1~~PLAT3511.1.p1  ORF type:complete len:176 (-),score=14.27 PLAT3511.1:85-612(-)